jgi:predicted ATP-binding protein involved in virulence
VNPTPPVEEAQWLVNYTALIEDGTQDTEQGQQLREKLNSHYGAHHPVILDCDRLIRFQTFKRLKSTTPEH